MPIDFVSLSNVYWFHIVCWDLYFLFSFFFSANERSLLKPFKSQRTVIVVAAQLEVCSKKKKSRVAKFEDDSVVDINFYRAMNLCIDRPNFPDFL